jgi:ribonuclease BN (tRNA processing enzyme)
MLITAVRFSQCTQRMIRCRCQIIGTGAGGSTPCLLASVERLPLYGKRDEAVPTVLARYLFNVGEGSARCASEHGVKLAAVSKVFLTGTSGDDCTGLPGLILSLGSLGAPALQVFGPKGVHTVVAATQDLLRRNSPEVTATPLELDAGESSASFELEDAHLDVHAGICSTQSSSSSRAAKRQRTQQSWRQHLALYRCQVKHGDRPSFLVLSCPHIEHAALLAAHNLVQQGADFVFHFTSAAVANSEQYAQLLLQRRLGQHIIVNAAGVGQLLHRKVAEHSVSLHTAAPLAFPLHWALRPPAVGALLQQQQQHAAAMNNSGLYTQGEPLLQVVLLPADERGVDASTVLPAVDVADIRARTEADLQALGLVQARTEAMQGIRDARLNALTITQQQQQQAAVISSATTAAAASNFSAAAAMRARLQGKKAANSSSVSTAATSTAAQQPPVQPASTLYFLGTGSAAPSKSRGCSGLLLQLHSDWTAAATAGAAAVAPLTLLMDAGEGTFGHLERQFGRQGALAQLLALDCIWISHKHADHMTGLWRVLSLRSAALAANAISDTSTSAAATVPLPVIAPRAVLSWLAACAAASPHAVLYTPIDCDRCRVWQGHIVVRLVSVPVIHCAGAFGLVITDHVSSSSAAAVAAGPPRVILVYSGDTRPCAALAAAGRGATILVVSVLAVYDNCTTVLYIVHTSISTAQLLLDQYTDCACDATHLILDTQRSSTICTRVQILSICEVLLAKDKACTPRLLVCVLTLQRTYIDSAYTHRVHCCVLLRLHARSTKPHSTTAWLQTRCASLTAQQEKPLQ